ncbi:MAG: GTP-binding protein [Bacillota bacterium]
MINDKIRNLGILAHVDAGKTTISEYMLYKSGRIRSQGRVDEGTASTDWLEVERQRGISVKSAVTSLEWQGVNINLIDTPGHADFAAEVERTLWVMDCAILVISAAEGVEAQTERLWQALDSMDIPVLIFINKIDRKAADCGQVLTEIRNMLSDDIVVLQEVKNECSKNCSVDNIIPQKPEIQFPDENIIEFVANHDSEVLEKYVDGKKITVSYLKDKLVELVREKMAYPVLFGSALQEVGLDELLDAVITYLPGPEIVDGPPAGIVFKIEHDDNMGRLSYVRLYSGQIENRDQLKNITRDTTEKITQIRKTFVQKHQDVGQLKAGDIGTICGFSESQVGDILGNRELVPRQYELAVPLLKVQVYPEEKGNYRKLVEAVQVLADEDPLLGLEWIKESREIHLKIMGLIQLEVLGTIFTERFGLHVKFSKPSIIYKETPKKSGEGYISYTMPKPCWAVLRFEIEPAPRGSGVDYDSEVRNDVILPRYQKQVADTIPRALEQGLYGWEVTDLKIRLVDGEYHVEHTHPPDFTVATPMGIMDGLDNTGTFLLEPILDFQIIVSEEVGGSVLNQLAQRRAEVESPEIKKNKFLLQGKIPLAAALDYPVKLSSTTGGRGIMETKFAGYRKCPPEKGSSCPRRGVNPLDQSNYILSVRNAIGK